MRFFICVIDYLNGMADPMRCIDSLSTDISFNLAAQEYLLKQDKDHYFMLWQSSSDMVLGTCQPVFNIIFIENLKYIDCQQCLWQIIDFLSSIDVDAEFDEDMNVCVDGLKVATCTQVIHKHRVLYHCTLYYTIDLPDKELMMAHNRFRRLVFRYFLESNPQNRIYHFSNTDMCAIYLLQC